MNFFKKLRPSRRGLTFSYRASDILPVGTHYSYIVDAKEGTIIIVPDENGSMTVSRKGAGKNKKPLIDIRRHDVRSMVSAADYLIVESIRDGIRVRIYSDSKEVCAGSGESFRVLQSESRVCDIRDIFGKKTGEIFVPMDILLASGNNYPLQMYGRPTLADSDYFRTLVSGCSSFSGLSHEQKGTVAKNLDQVYRMISLFSGAGLFDYAWTRDRRIRVVYANDFNAAACRTYQENIGTIECCPISDINEGLLPDANIVCGGPPCQGYSAANRRNLTSSASEEKRLFIDDYIRIVDKKNPEVFVIENAPQMLTMKDGFYLNRVLEHLSGRYEISTQVVKDCDVGGYTTRKRLFCIGSRIGRISLPDIHILPMKTVGDAFKLLDHSWPNMSDISNNNDKVRECMSYVAPGHNWKDIPSSVQTFAANKHSSVYHRLDLHGQSPTIVNYRKTCLIHPTESRGLSVSEAAVLMGLDKHFRFVGKLSDMQQQVANGVTMAMGTLVRKTVVKCLDAFHAGTGRAMA